MRIRYPLSEPCLISLVQVRSNIPKRQIEAIAIGQHLMNLDGKRFSTVPVAPLCTGQLPAGYQERINIKDGM